VTADLKCAHRAGPDLDRSLKFHYFKYSDNSSPPEAKICAGQPTKWGRKTSKIIDVCEPRDLIATRQRVRAQSGKFVKTLMRFPKPRAPVGRHFIGLRRTLGAMIRSRRHMGATHSSTGPLNKGHAHAGVLCTALEPQCTPTANHCLCSWRLRIDSGRPMKPLPREGGQPPTRGHPKIHRPNPGARRNLGVRGVPLDALDTFVCRTRFLKIRDRPSHARAPVTNQGRPCPVRSRV
jgi:hypothetical protein